MLTYFCLLVGQAELADSQQLANQVSVERDELRIKLIRAAPALAARDGAAALFDEQYR
jgi:hypothetical protein